MIKKLMTITKYCYSIINTKAIKLFLKFKKKMMTSWSSKSLAFKLFIISIIGIVSKIESLLPSTRKVIDWEEIKIRIQMFLFFSSLAPTRLTWEFYTSIFTIRRRN